MSNIPISSLPIALSLTGSEAVPLVQAGTTKTATVSLINASNIANIPIGGLTGQGLVKQSNANYDTIWKTVSGFGTVQEVDTGTGLTGGPITVTGALSLAPVAAGAVLANITGGSAAPLPNTLSSIMDLIGSERGDILFRGASGWGVLPPSTSGRILTTGGVGADPAWSNVGSGTVQSVALALPGIFTVSGSPVTTTGTLTGTLNTQNANLVWAGPATGAAAAPTFRSLVGADLPNPSASTLGGIQSTVGASHQWIGSISTSGVPALIQPAFSDISGIATGAQLPSPTLSTLGGIQAINAITSNWIRSINTSGVPQLSQPAFSDISGIATLAQLPSIGNNTILANISGASSTPLANSLSTIIDNSIASTQGDILYRNASAWVALPPGTSGQVLSSGGTAANLSWATVSGTGTVTSVATNNGLTGGPITSTGTVGLATIATGNVLAYTGAGSGVPVATAPTTVLDVIGSTEGDILYRGASTWAVLAPGTVGQHLQTGGAGSTPSWASAVTSVATAYPLSGGTITSTGTLQSVAPQQCGRFTFVSSTAVKFAPYNGDLIKINGLLLQIPSAGIAGVANTSVFVNGVGASNLAASTIYYVYAFNNSGTVTADFSTTAHASSSTAGNVGTEIKIADDTRSLVGMVFTNASSQFASNTTITWFSRRPQTSVGAVATTATTTSTGLTELSTNARTDFMLWSGEEVTIKVMGQVSSSVATADVVLNLGLDGGTTGLLVSSATNRPSAVSGTLNMWAYAETSFTGTEGHHFVSPLVSVSSGTGTFNFTHAEVRNF